ncbi:glycosyltransferase family 2 protein [Vibrio breoganii]|uniref:glycosyltransferase family 2 protein n=1 Tax=Vibrio breoganii TaxID=553239 RepID=UPI000C85350D|nr:glycosyltransferase family 2 protein [Vibrio breoganii]PMG39548.1 acyltransferase [Vibrio breoganii]PMG82076.1 acyltransferase [Vibrio breoganii]PMG93273.1 acyltransferase [Vibrio breoganii]PMK38993.1 acyltransferase [Vibrio breoganii]PMM50187.1 acyltransferase [Vibrio breoganii]
MDKYLPCFLIPCYNHGSTIETVVTSLASFSLHIIVVDDGSDDETKQNLRKISKQQDITLVTLPVNTGKGGAVMAGIRTANELGYTHTVQIDADGQHDIEALPSLLASSRQKPENLISGKPIYDDSVPKSRLYGRYATHIWVWIETLSFTIEDSMCGFRAYPVTSTLNVLDKYSIGTRMDFDIEILVRLYWEGINIDFIDTHVIYPEGGISHFDGLKDNVKISWMHTRLFFEMLPRIPSLLKRKKNASHNTHWSKRQEQGTIFGIKLLLAVYSLLGRKVFNLVLKPVIGYYNITSNEAKQASNAYLKQLTTYAQNNAITLTKPLDSYHHLLSFGHTMLDKLAAWKGDYNIENLTVYGQEHFQGMVDKNQGILILGSHLGNIELCRALSRRHSHIKINALVFTENAERFNTVMKAVNPNSELNLIQVSSLGVDTAILLKQKIEQGEWVVIVGDRTSTSKESRSVWAEFLGKLAPFPQGPFILASVLQAPVYLLFGLRDDSKIRPHFDVYFEPFRESINLPRKTRQQALEKVVQDYATRLQHYTLQAPLQWYNFFDFWTLSNKKDDK